MPLYEYKCQSCGDVFEVIQKFSDEPLSVHEKCGGAVERLLSAPALQFKGTGWYVTDYGKGNGKEAKPKTESKNGGGSSDSNGKSDSGSTAKSESSTSNASTTSSSSDTK